MEGDGEERKRRGERKGKKDRIVGGRKELKRRRRKESDHSQREK